MQRKPTSFEDESPLESLLRKKERKKERKKNINKYPLISKLSNEL